MPDTPSKEALEAAWPLDQQMHRNHGHDHDYCQFRIAIARALEAYAAERIEDNAIVRRECITHIKEATRWKAQFESTNAAGIGVAEKLAVSEERVRMLESALESAVEIIGLWAHETGHPALRQAFTAALAKAGRAGLAPQGVSAGGTMTNADLIAEARRRAHNWGRHAYSGDDLDRAFEMLATLADALEAAERCTTCDGQPHASGKICICGGSGRRADETLNLRQQLQASEAQVARLRALIIDYFGLVRDAYKNLDIRARATLVEYGLVEGEAG